MKYVNAQNFIGYVRNFKDEIIGTDTKGKDTTVKKEFVELYKLCAQYVEAVNAYTYAYEKGELDADQAINYTGRCDRALEKAVKKLCFMNSVAKKHDASFLTKLINRGSRQACNTAVMELFSIVNDILDENVYIAKAV